jgi:putative membrane protein
MDAVLAAGRLPSSELWRWHAHPEVWLLVAALGGLYVYAARVIGPKVVPPGTRPVSRRQWCAFAAGIALLWFASDWPVHDIGEQYLFFVHMSQHLLLTLVMAPLFLLATPRWLADLVLGSGRVRKVVRSLSRPVVAGVVYNAGVVLTHWPTVVDGVVAHAWAHFGLHLLVVATALLMWMPVCGPIEEWRISLPAQMVYLFLMSVVPTVPGAWLTFATNPLYSAYDTPLRAFGISAVDDQQAAGLIMKLAGGIYFWTIITSMFFVWAARHEKAQAQGRMVTERDILTWHSDGGAEDDGDAVLTYDEVELAFARTAAAHESTAPPDRSL